MRSIDGSLVRAAGVLGASPWVSFRKVFFPLSIPGISAGSALVFMMSLGFFITPALLGGPKHLMAAVLIEQQANRFLNWGLASALSTILLVVTLAIYAVYVRLTRGGGGLHHGG
jgi:putative spermidine/putrescine transport system permease protein